MSYTCPFDSRDSCMPSILPWSVFVMRTRILEPQTRRSSDSFQCSFRPLFLSSRLRTADTAQRAVTVALDSSVSTGVHHPDVAEGKIVPDRILNVDRAQGGGDFGRHL